MPRRRPHHLCRQLPRRTDCHADGLPLDSHVRTLEHLRTPHLQAHQRHTRSAELPRSKSGSEQRFHDSAVHSRIGGEPQQVARYAVVCRQHPVEPGSGRPCEHGCQCSHQTVQGGAQHGARACHRTLQRGSGSRVSPSAEVVAGCRSYFQGIPQGGAVHCTRRSNVSAHC